MVMRPSKADDGRMESMHIAVQAIRRDRGKGLLVAQVRAASRERIRGLARAVIHLTIHLPEPKTAMEECALRHRVREEALRYLDVS